MQHSVSAADGLCETLLIQSFELVRRASFSRRAVDMLFSPARALPMFFLHVFAFVRSKCTR